MTDDRSKIKTHLPGGTPIIVLDPDKEMPWFVATDGSAIGVESLALNPSYSFARNVLVPERTVAMWLGFPSLLFLYRLVPEDLRMAPRKVLAPPGSQEPYEDCWHFEYVIELLTTVKVEEIVRKKALREAWNYLTVASLQVVRNTWKSVHPKLLVELHDAKLQVEKLKAEGPARSSKARLPPYDRNTFPEASCAGFFEDGDVRVSYDEQKFVYVRFPRETYHTGVPTSKFMSVPGRSRENHDKFPSLVPAEVHYPICFVDGSAEKDTIVVGFSVLPHELAEVKGNQKSRPNEDAWLELAKRTLHHYAAHHFRMKDIK